MESYRLKARISGRVQMVGFRYSTKQKAHLLGLSGWVRNESDGDVSVCAEGSRSSLRELEAWLHQGPPAARVSRVESRWEESSGEFFRFSVEG